MQKKVIRYYLLVLCYLFVALSTHSVLAALPWYFGDVKDPKQAAPASTNLVYLRPGPNKVVVAVIDGGVLSGHPALSGVLMDGFDMVSPVLNSRGGRSRNYAPDTSDAVCGRKLTSSAEHTHGTEVASVIAGNGYEDMWGINPAARIVPIRLFGACGMSPSDMVDAIRWAAGLPVNGLPNNEHPAHVINISIAGGSTICNVYLQNAIDEVIAKGVFIVAAAGNTFQKPLTEPAACKGVISVGSLSADSQIEVYSALDPRTTIYTVGGGKKLDISAPWALNKIRVATTEIGLLGAEKNVVKDKGIGTSFAAPIVSGFISLWLSHQPQLRPDEWLSALPQFVRPVPKSDRCLECTPSGLQVPQVPFLR